ncbi:MAG: hypothetical protein OXP71_05090 [Candidatus Poribacteria bacterium]|nr:hypothetical protein [Candidatus Poribacteria bacterium]
MRRLVLMFCLITGAAILSGCGNGLLSWTTVPLHSEVSRPTFCLHDKSEKSEHLYQIADPLYIGEIAVFRFWQTEKHNQQDLGVKTPWRGHDKCFWRMQYRPTDKQTSHPLHCIRYGEVPPGYKELVPAKPLEVNRVYTVNLYNLDSYSSEAMRFILRPDSTGAPVRLEYAIGDYVPASQLEPIVIERQATEQ